MEDKWIIISPTDKDESTVDMSTIKYQYTPPGTMDIPCFPELPAGALICIIFRSRNRLLSEWASHNGITLAVVSHLVYLSKHPDATQDEISRRMMIDKAAVARAIRQLEESGYLTRTPEKTNRRKYRLSLTKKGIRLAKDAVDAADEIDREITAGLPEEAQPYLLPILQMMAHTSSTLAETRDTTSNDK